MMSTRIPTTSHRHWLVLAAAVVMATVPCSAATVRDAQPKMGSPFSITAVADDEAAATAAVAAAFAEIERIEDLISSWRADSETSAVNRAAGTGPVVVSPELFGLVRRSLEVSKLTGGAFDITFAGAGQLWDFKARPPEIPNPDELRRRLDVVGFHAVRLDPEARTVELTRAGMRIGFGGIGKGFAANRAVRVLKDAGMRGGVVNAGGDLVAFGRRDNGEPWTIGLADPLQPDAVFARLDLTDQAIVTSGDYERFIELDGVRYAHILDPRTGWPVRGVRSVTVVCPDGELADALATSVFVLGVEEGLTLINRLRGVEALVIDDTGQLHPSSAFNTRMVQPSTEPSGSDLQEKP